MGRPRHIRFTWRLATAAARRLPDVLIVGAQKAGTTTLHAQLVEHPDVLAPFRKEVHYFDRNHHRGERWYRAHFAYRGAGGEGSVTGEASPSYMFHPLAAARIGAEAPDAKLIAVLRDPIDRAWSHYHHKLRAGHETLSFEEALAREDERLAGEEQRVLADPLYDSAPLRHFSYVARGLYVDQLERLVRHVPRERLLVLRAEDLFADGAAAFRRVTDFLGLSPLDVASLPRKNSGKQGGMPAAVRARLAETFAPSNERLYEWLGRDLGWTRP